MAVELESWELTEPTRVLDPDDEVLREYIVVNRRNGVEGASFFCCAYTKLLPQLTRDLGMLVDMVSRNDRFGRGGLVSPKEDETNPDVD